MQRNKGESMGVEDGFKGIKGEETDRSLKVMPQTYLTIHIASSGRLKLQHEISKGSQHDYRAQDSTCNSLAL